MTFIQSPIVGQMTDFAHPQVWTHSRAPRRNIVKELLGLSLLLLAAPVTVAWWTLLLWLAWP
jgi:hypothetical protein